MKAKEVASEDFIKWFSELNKSSINVAGGKGANLGEMFNLKIPVPNGFVITAQAYDFFIEKSGVINKVKELLSEIDYENTKELDEITGKIRRLIVSAEFPKELENEIKESYENLSSGNEEVDYRIAQDYLRKTQDSIFVAVRSSATAEDLEDASFAGQQDSYLNIKGNEELLESIKKCFASLFTSRATYYRNKKGFKHEETSLAVVVQKMVDSDKSGVLFTKDPVFKDNNTIIEAVYGLGEGIVSGQITPDKYIVSEDLKVLNKKIADKKIAITRNAEGKKITVKLNEERSNAQVLKDSEIKKLTEIGLRLEDHYKKPQDIEFAIESNEIYIVQTRAITTVKTRVAEEKEEIKGEVVLSGLAASPGIGIGKVKIVKSVNDLNNVKEGDVLVTKMTNPDMVVTMQKASAIVTDEGGLTAHAAIVSREMGLPCIVGTKEGTFKLKEGEIVTVDATNGKVYKGKVGESKGKTIEKITADTKTKLKVIVDLPSFAERASRTGIKEVGLLRMEGIISESGKHPNYFLKQNKIKDYEEVIFNGVSEIAKYFDKLWVRTSDIRSDEFQNLLDSPKEKEANPMLGFHGIRYGLKNPEILKAELNALKRVSERNKEIGILLPQVIMIEEVQEVKKMLNEIGFTKAKLGIMIETPASVQLIKNFCEEGVDFVSFGTNDLTQYFLGVDRGNEKVQHLYNEMHPGILYQLEFVIRTAKRYNVETSICGQAGSNKEMVKFLVEKGIDSVSVNADVAKEISDYIYDLENPKDNLDFPMKIDKSELVDPREFQTSEVTEEEEVQEENSENKKDLDIF